jgi:hypothetical protein
MALSSAAFAAKTVTPKSGTYEDTTKNDTYKIVKMGRDRYGVKLILVWVTEFSCSGAEGGKSFYLGEPKPIPIKNGKFDFEKTDQQTGGGGAVTATNEFHISGTVKSPTKIVGRKSVHSNIEAHFPNAEPIKEVCTGDEAFIAKLK